MAAVAAAETPAAPRAALVAHHLTVSLPADILRGREMQRQITGGLTTAFVTTIDDRSRSGSHLRGAVRIEIRYELWDENFLVVAIDMTGQKQTHTFETLDKLVAWWVSSQLRIADVEAADAPASIHLKTEVVPFSAAEEADAQRWLMHSISATGAQQSQQSHADAPGNGILDMIIGTGVHRKPLQSWRWVVPVSRQ